MLLQIILFGIHINKGTTMKKLFFFLLVLVASMAFTKETSPAFAPMMIGAKGWAADAKPLVGDN